MIHIFSITQYFGKKICKKGLSNLVSLKTLHNMHKTKFDWIINSVKFFFYVNDIFTSKPFFLNQKSITFFHQLPIDFRLNFTELTSRSLSEMERILSSLCSLVTAACTQHMHK